MDTSMPSVTSSGSPSGFAAAFRSTEAPPPVPAALAPPCGSSSSSMLPTSAATVDVTALSSCVSPESAVSSSLPVSSAGLSEAAPVPFSPDCAPAPICCASASTCCTSVPTCCASASVSCAPACPDTAPAVPPQPRSVRITATTTAITSMAAPAGTAMVTQSVLLLLCRPCLLLFVISAPSFAAHKAHNPQRILFFRLRFYYKTACPKGATALCGN